MMADVEETLELHGHGLLPIDVEDGAVRVWRCTDCGHEGNDASEFLEITCGEGADAP